MSEIFYDVVVVGAGNAALSAALSAREHGARVLVLERAPERKRGGNSHFTGGLVRFPYNGLEDIRALIPDMTDEEAGQVDVGHYTEEEFFQTIAQVTEYKADADLTSLYVSEAYPTIKWLQSKGVRFALALGRQAFKSGEKFRFWGGAPVEYVGGGVGLIEMLFESTQRHGVEIWYSARATQLLTDESGRVTGVKVARGAEKLQVQAGAVVLACGGFHANLEMRTKYLGPDWDLAVVRGTEFNTGDGINMALAIGAQPYGHFSGCHSVAWDQNGPTARDRKVGDPFEFQRLSYPFGITVNRDGKRFLDEGADFRNYTYSTQGKEILKQPARMAVQIFDAKVMHLLRDEYRLPQVTKVTTDSLEELAEALEINPHGLVETVKEFNAACMDKPFDPTVKDGKGTVGITPPKSNWALPIDTPPYVGFPATCAITFTFGGLKVNTRAQVLDTEDAPIAGLYAAGELVGGLFYHSYPGGTGLTTGAVFGRIAGRDATALRQARA